MLYHDSLSLWHGTAASPWRGHVRGSAVTGSVAEQRGLGVISTTSVDHPFHIHTNPCWVSLIEITAANGELVNILNGPRWQDVVWIPRNRGRVVFRSRFWDFLGVLVNHCHILLHEDNGMMQIVEVVPGAEHSNYAPSDWVAQPGMNAAQVSAIYPRASLEAAFHQNVTFVDANPVTGQTFPGVPYR